MRHVTCALLLTAASAAAGAQEAKLASAPVQFEVVSIRRHVGTDPSARSSRTLPDGLTMMTNMPISVPCGPGSEPGPRVMSSACPSGQDWNATTSR